MNALEKNLAVARGEALAASLLAEAALRAVFASTPDHDGLLKVISDFVDDTLNQSGPGKGDGHDELNMQMRETARFRADQSLPAIALMIGDLPPSAKR